MPARPQVLYLVHRVPYPPNRGDRIRSFHCLNYLAARADVHLAFTCEEPPPAETMEVLESLCCQVAAVPLGPRTRWLHAARSVAAGRTATEGLFHAPSLTETLRRWTEQTRFDAALVFCSSMAQYLDEPGLAGTPVVVDLVDVDSQKWFDYAASARGPKSWLFRLEGRRLRRLEQSLAARARAVVLVSGHEADVYRGFCSTGCVRAIANGVDLDYFQPAPAANDGQPRCVFVGALDYLANVDGVQWFCDGVWPEVRRQRPAARLTLVGSRPGAAVRRLAELAGVELAADVPDVRPYLAGAAVAVVPLRVARGLQNKVLEALAMGKAVVATPQALEGLDVEPGVNVWSASTARQWIDALLALLDDAARRRELGAAGRCYVENRHRWETCLEPLGELLGLAPRACAAAR